MRGVLDADAHISIVVRHLGKRSMNGTYRLLVTAFDARQAVVAWEIMRSWWYWDERWQKVKYPVRAWALTRTDLSHILVAAHPERQPPTRTPPGGAAAAASSSHLPRPQA